MAELGICAIFKNEENYLYEWLSYHYEIGVRRFSLYNNNSTDRSVDVIRGWPHRECVEIVNWPVPRGQIPAYQDFINRNRETGGWCAFIDCDEFLTPVGKYSVPDFLDFVPPLIGGVYVFWYMFGSSGHITRPQGLITETFTHRAPECFGSHHYGKCILRLKLAERASIHVFGSVGKIVTDVGIEIDQTSIGFQPQESHEFLAIYHYFTKSLEEWRQRRSMGRATRVAGDPNFQRTEAEFYQHDRNDVVDLRAANIMRRARKEFYPS